MLQMPPGEVFCIRCHIRPFHPAKPSKKGEANNKPKSRFSFLEKAKSLVFEQEVILEEKDLDEPMWALEMALMESDVALPVAEEIVKRGQVRSGGKEEEDRSGHREAGRGLPEKCSRKSSFQELSGLRRVHQEQGKAGQDPFRGRERHRKDDQHRQGGQVPHGPELLRGPGGRRYLPGGSHRAVGGARQRVWASRSSSTRRAATRRQ